MARPRKVNAHLPPHVYERRGMYYFQTRDKRWIPLGSRLESAIKQAKKLAPKPRPLEANVRAHLGRTLSRARERAKKRGQPFNLEASDVMQLWKRSRGRCDLTGITFRFDREDGFSRRPYAPSIDRIDSRKPYSSVNCRLVCTAVNIAINEWGLETFAEFARALRCSLKNYRRDASFTDSTCIRTVASD